VFEVFDGQAIDGFAYDEPAVNAFRLQVNGNAFDKSRRFIAQMHDLAHPDRFTRISTMVEAVDHFASARAMNELFEPVIFKRTAEDRIERGTHQVDSKTQNILSGIAFDAQHEEMGQQFCADCSRMELRNLAAGQ
jgi:hypothetical protein